MTERDVTPIAVLPRRLPWTRQRIGVAIGPAHAVAVEVRRGTGAWTLDGPGADQAGGYEQALEALLERMPRPRGAWPSCEVVVAVERDVVQVKCIFGLPAGADLQTANAIVREGPSRFFRRTADLLLTSQLHERTDGSRWAAAYRGDTVRGILRACANQGARLRAIVPAETGATAGTGSIGATPGATAHDAASISPATLHARLPAPIGVEPAGPFVGHKRQATLAATLALAMLTAGPLVVAKVTSRSAAAQHAAIRSQELAALRTAAELDRVSETLRELGARHMERTSAVELLASLAAALPPGAVLTHLQVDSAGGTLVVLSPSTERVMTDLEGSASLAALEVVGPVSRERIAERELDRVSLRFRHAVRTATEGMP